MPSANDHACPICACPTAERRSFSIDEVTTHFIPAFRDRARHNRLRALLAELWDGRETVSVHQCSECAFGFAVPLIAGDERFYNLVTESNPHYPSWRWEFQRTLECLGERPGGRSGDLHLLEVGAGRGAFLGQARAVVGDALVPVATEYDSGAVSGLRRAGYEVVEGAFQELAAETRYRGRFDVICLFQTLEHIADVHGAFRALAALLRADGDIFVSVPYGPSIELQEELVGYWDVPPNHVARWSPRAFAAISSRHGLDVSRWELEPVSRIVSAWRLAQYAVLASAYDEHSVAGRVNAVRVRWLRGPAKRVLASAHLPGVAKAWSRLLPATQWVHLTRQPAGAGAP